MKKIISIIFLVFFTAFSLSFPQEGVYAVERDNSTVVLPTSDTSAYAAAPENSTVILLTSDTSASTSRVTANEMLTFNVINTGSEKVSYRIFENGYPQTLYLNVLPGENWSNKIRTSIGKGYSLRIYCESSSGTGCKASGVIANYF